MQQIHTKVHLTSNFMLWLSDTLFWEAIRTDLLFLCAIVSVWQKSIWLVVLWHKKERPLIVQKTILSNKEQTTKKKVKIATIRTDCCMSMCMQNRQICLTLHDSVTFISTMHTIHKHSQFHSIVILLNNFLLLFLSIWLNLCCWIILYMYSIFFTLIN